MDERYKEIDLEIMEHIQCSPCKGLYFVDLANLGYDSVKVHKSLKKLISRNFLKESHDFNGANFSITENSREMNVVKVSCPICNTIRRTHRDNQHTIHCLNKECRTPRGTHRNFWLINIDHFRKGDIKRINNVN